jgi:hypothetical protein
VFSNDGTGAKLGYFLERAVQIVAGTCQPDGRRELELRVNLENTAPASGLPEYVVGVAAAGEPYVLRTNMLVMAPLGGLVVAAERDGLTWPLAHGVDHAHPIATSTVDLAAGESTEIVVRVRTVPGTNAESVRAQPKVLLTPGVTPWDVSVEEFRTCRPSPG